MSGGVAGGAGGGGHSLPARRGQRASALRDTEKQEHQDTARGRRDKRGVREEQTHRAKARGSGAVRAGGWQHCPQSNGNLDVFP